MTGGDVRLIPVLPQLLLQQPTIFNLPLVSEERTPLVDVQLLPQNTQLFSIHCDWRGVVE